MKRILLLLTVGLLLSAYSFADDSSETNVKKSKNNICHDKSSRSYNRTKTYTSYDTIEECLASGGRLPKK
ncbi:hypothetical protein G3496_03575 [Shewanella baltica]|uniref:hypothetical protein n=1 Tax=Shewanella baltica TaxID=62322 RepID=UPI00217CCD28|nr:hypothetical protein [Shewanella baltica]MCS6134004.1 hypothetical protein [Shewanella baltica]